jgi:Tfp pilus assembly protein PilO
VAMSSLKISRKSLVVLIAVAAALLGCDLIVYVVASGWLRQAETVLSSRESQVENSKKVAMRLDASQRKYEEVAAKLTVLERSVSKAEYMPTMLKQLETAGKAVKLDVVGVRPVISQEKPASTNKSAGSEQDGASSSTAAGAAAKKKAPKPPYDTMLVDIEVEGSYWNTMRFLDGLTKFPKIVAVNSVQMSPNGVSLRQVIERPGGGRFTVSPSLNIKLNLCAFIFPVEKGSITTAKSDPAASVNVEPAPLAQSRKPVRVGKKNWRSGHEAG